MIKDMKAALTTSISDVLETMFYMPLEFEDTGDPESRGIFDTADLRVCKLDFKGAISGYLIMMIPETQLVSMAVDFMGEDRGNIARMHTDGIIMEVVNMVLGHMLSNIDEKRDFHLGIPQILEDRTLVQSIRKQLPECFVLAESIEGLLLSALVLED
jgi:chemotaxis protein CheY-P-specific phosphatase CheC